MVLGAIHAGMGCTSLNKLFACSNVPAINHASFKRYEREIGPAIEMCAKESCKRAAEEERRLVIEKIEELWEELPAEIKNEVFPEISILRSSWPDDSSSFQNKNDDSNNNEQNFKDNSQRFDGALGNVVNILISYDMGWSRRGNGKSYDSLNGYGAMIGFLSGKVLDYASRNRGCKRCNAGRSKEEHDCRLNHTGSAKAMESSVGAQLVNKSTILKETGVNARVVIGDDDSLTISEIRRGNPLKIFKLSDTNHLRKRFVGDLYAIKPRFKEMRQKKTIPHLKKCFGYAIKQNKGNTARISSALRNIPHHVFGHHENCGSWCHRTDSEDNAKGQKITLQDHELYIVLETIFEKYASQAVKFSMAASSQANESLNNIIAHKAPKNRCYSLSESCDYRVASAVASKNEGEKYVLDVQHKLFSTSGNNTKVFVEQQKRIHNRRASLARLPKTKKNRNFLIQEKENRRKSKEKSEGVRYEPNCDMNVDPEEPIASLDAESIINQLPSIELSAESCNILYFDLETSGFASKADILQIAGKLGDENFSVYIKPSHEIDSRASDVTGLKIINGNLYHHDKQVECVSIKQALTQFQLFLDSSSKPCLLTAHNAKFDSSLLLNAIINNSMVDKFVKIAGFSDTCVIFKKLFPSRKGPGAFKLSELARDLLKIEECDGFHEAMFDVEILEKLTSSFIPKENLVSNCKLYKESIMLKLFSPHLHAFKKIVSSAIVKKMAMAGITLDILKKCYAENGRECVIQILSKKDPNKNVTVTKDKRVLSKIVEFLANQ